MKKNSVICFRASKDLHEALANLAHEDRRSVSSLIELILTDYLKVRNSPSKNKYDDEKRKHYRKQIAASALIKRSDETGKTQYHTGAIVDISLGGLRIKMSRNVKCEISQDPKTSHMEIMFTMPSECQPIFITCEPRRVMETEESLVVGASLVGADLQGYEAIKKYLM